MPKLMGDASAGLPKTTTLLRGFHPIAAHALNRKVVGNGKEQLKTGLRNGTGCLICQCEINSDIRTVERKIYEQTKKASSHHHENLKQHARALVTATSHIAEGNVSEARNKLNDLLETVGDAVEDAESALQDKLKQADNFVKENPYKTAGFAIGIRALIGFFLARRGK